MSVTQLLKFVYNKLGRFFDKAVPVPAPNAAQFAGPGVSIAAGDSSEDAHSFKIVHH
jgi:hypothetical protein